jgi:hypothetical protein
VARVVASAEELPIRCKSIDLAILAFSIKYLLDTHALTALAEVVAERGIVMVIDYAVESIVSLAPLGMELVRVWPFLDAPATLFANEHWIQHVVTQVGFRIKDWLRVPLPKLQEADDAVEFILNSPMLARDFKSLQRADQQAIRHELTRVARPIFRRSSVTPEIFVALLHLPPRTACL